MSNTRGPIRRRVAAALAATCALLGVVPVASAQETTTEATAQVVSNAEFRWSINNETRGRAFAPGTYNLMSAGDISTAIPGQGKTIDQSAWKQSAGEVSIDRRTADGVVAPATWAGTQQSAGFKLAQGAAMGPAGSGDHSGLEAVFSGGSGTLDTAAGTADITWKGAITVLYYSGMSYFTLTDPELKVDKSGATLTAVMGAHRASMTDSTLWEKMPSSREIVANFAAGKVDLGAKEGGVTATPDFEGVRYPGGQQVQSGDGWGSFPVGFVDYLSQAGAGAYWYTSGGAADKHKVPNPVAVSWDAAAPVTPEPETPTTPGGNGTSTSSGSRLEKFLNDVTDAAQAKVLENTNKITGDWIDQAFGNGTATTTTGGTATTTTGGTATTTATTGRSTTTTSRSTAVRDVGDYLVSTGQPVTAGTVGRVVSSTSQPTSTTSGSGGSTSSTGRSTSSPATGAQMTQAQSSPAYAAASKQAVDGQPVLYSSTSADAADGLAHHWQWLLGLALLAAAAVLVFLTRTRKA